MSRSEGLMTCFPLGLSLVRMIVWAARCVDRVRNDDASESRAYPQFFYEAEPRQLLPRTSTRIAVVKVLHEMNIVNLSVKYKISPTWPEELQFSHRLRPLFQV